MAKAQGSLEYLIIIAAVLSISAIVVLYLTGVFGGQVSAVSIGSCKQATVDCKVSRMISPNDPCLACNSSCKDVTTGKEIFPNATLCCVQARADMIYANSPGCGGGVAQDTTPPTVSITSPTGGATVSGTVTIQATASDASGINKVEFLIDGSLIGTDTTDPYSYSWDTTAYTNAQHTITARATDNAGNTGSASVTVNVNNVAPPPNVLTISFVPPTPDNGASQTQDSVYVNVSSSSGSVSHYTVLDWNRTLVGWWRLDGNTRDNITGALGTITGSPSVVTGAFGQAYSFNGMTDYIALGSGLYDYPNMTVCAWFKLTSAVASGLNQRIVTSGSENTNQWILTLGSTNYLYMANQTASYTTPRSNSPIADTNWHFACGVNNPNALYLDGELQTGSASSSWSTTTNTKIGARGDAHFFNGTIDDVKMFKRVLSSQEIKALYNANAYQYYNNFTNLGSGAYTYKAYAVNSSGTVKETEQRTVTISAGAPALSSVAISGVSNIAVGATDSDITCTATSVNGNVQANISLQYNNSGAWINLNATNTATNVRYNTAPGTNPRWGQTVTTSGTAVTFAVDGLVVSSGNQFRCNASIGPIGSPTASVISSTASMNVLSSAGGLTISFVPPTPNAGASQTQDSVYVNVSSDSGSVSHYTILDWNRSLVGWWRFEGNALDNSTYKNDGTVNGATYTSAGKFGGAYSFDGVDDYVKPPDAAIPSTTSYTMVFWVKRLGWDSRSNYNAIMGWGTTSQPKLGVLYRNDVGKFYFGGWGTDYSTAVNFPTGVWYHVAVVVSANTAKMYIDTANVGMNIDVSTVTKSNFYIGRTIEQNSNLYNFNGIIDDVQIYNRAFSLEEINASYNANSYKYYHNFTSLATGAYTYKAYAVNSSGTVRETEQRTITILSTPPPGGARLTVVGTQLAIGGVTVNPSLPMLTGVDDTNALLGLMIAYIEGQTYYEGWNQNFPHFEGPLTVTGSNFNEKVDNFWEQYFTHCESYGLKMIRLGVHNTWATEIMYNHWLNNRAQFYYILNSMADHAEAHSMYVALVLAGTADFPPYWFNVSENDGLNNNPFNVSHAAYKNYTKYVNDVMNQMKSKNGIGIIDLWNEPDHDYVYSKYWSPTFKANSKAAFNAWANNVSKDTAAYADSGVNFHPRTMGVAGQGTFFTWSESNFDFATGNVSFEICSRHYYASVLDNYLYQQPEQWADDAGKPLYWSELGNNTWPPCWVTCRWLPAEAKISSYGGQAISSMTLCSTPGYPTTNCYSS